MQDISLFRNSSFMMSLFFLLPTPPFFSLLLSLCSLVFLRSEFEVQRTHRFHEVMNLFVAVLFHYLPRLFLFCLAESSLNSVDLPRRV